MSSKGILVLPSRFFFVISRDMTRVLVFLIWIIIFLFQKAAGVYLLRSNLLVVSVLFGWCVWWHLMTKPALSSCLWKHHYVLFLLVWHMSSFFSFFFFRKSTPLSFFVFWFQLLCFLFFIFTLGSFIIYFYVFNLALKLQFIKY